MEEDEVGEDPLEIGKIALEIFFFFKSKDDLRFYIKHLI